MEKKTPQPPFSHTLPLRFASVLPPRAELRAGIDEQEVHLSWFISPPHPSINSTKNPADVYPSSTPSLHPRFKPKKGLFLPPSLNSDFKLIPLRFWCASGPADLEMKTDFTFICRTWIGIAYASGEETCSAVTRAR